MTLIDVWRGYLTSSDHGLHLADAGHPLEIFVGTTEAGAARMVIRSEAKPPRPQLSDVVLVERRQDAGNKWNLVFTLQDRKFDEVLLRLADDVHARSARASSEAAALDRVGVVIDEWRRLLTARPAKRMSMEELRGLVGELWLLLGRFSAVHGIAGAVEGWLGPMGLPQDFFFAADGHHEVKAIGPSTVRLKVSSEHQLDVEDLQLLVVRISNSDESALGAVNLVQLVGRVRTGLSSCGESWEGFEQRLSRLGVDLTDSFYEDTHFVVSRVSSYAVVPDFPAIRASLIAQSLGRVRYQIDLSAIEPFRTHDEMVN